MINSNPCIAYLMEENTITMQALVMAHACYGHNSFLKIIISSELDGCQLYRRLPDFRPELHYPL